MAIGLAGSVLLAGCGDTLALTHSETACITPGQIVTLHTSTDAGADLSYKVQDDFGGEVGDAIAPLTTDAQGNATVTWRSPSQLSTTTLHFLLTAKHAGKTASRDVHVVVGGNGRSC